MNTADVVNRLLTTVGELDMVNDELYRAIEDLVEPFKLDIEDETDAIYALYDRFC